MKKKQEIHPHVSQAKQPLPAVPVVSFFFLSMFCVRNDHLAGGFGITAAVNCILLKTCKYGKSLHLTVKKLCLCF